jgi:uncharacterized membrane protein YdjX (TVP38/TMEM64 family)
MAANNDQPTDMQGMSGKLSLPRFLPLCALAAISLAVIAAGWHRQISFEMLTRHHEILREFIVEHRVAAAAGYVALYAAAIALSLPIGLYLTVIGGILFGVALGAGAALIGATGGAVCVFLIARSAAGEHLVRRAGPLVQKLAEGFRADAFSYLLFLRLVPIFPFWLVNLVPALCGVRLASFASATAIGIIPATFAFASVGAGLESVIAAQKAAYLSCLATGQGDCRLEFHVRNAITPELLAALVALGVLALVPVVVKRLRARSRRPGSVG